MQKSTMLQLVFIIICILGYTCAIAQSDYLVLAKGDTLYGNVVHLNYGVDQKVQITDQNKKKSVYSMLQVKGFKSKNELFHLIKFGDTFKYMKLKQSGYLSLYSFQLQDKVTWDGLFLYKRDGKGIEVPNLGFKKRLSEFLAECPGVVEEISTGALGRNDLVEIIDKFNACIDENSKPTQTLPAGETVPTQAITSWNELESAVKADETLDDKENILEMISEAKSKTQRNEKIPKFLVDGLKKSLEQEPKLITLLSKALGETTIKE